MSLRKSARLSATPLRLFTDRVDIKASASSNSSNDSSPTFSLGDSFNSNDPSTSVTEADDYADHSAPHTVSSATMRSKSTTRRFSQSNIDHENRRSSGRTRKPTAKAQALNGSRSYSPPLSDTIVIGSSSTREDSPTNEQAPTATEQPPEPVNQSSPAPEVPEVPEVPETPASAKANGVVTPSQTPTEKDETLLSTIESPSRRTSQRERKPTAKVLEISTTAQKRPLTEVEDVRPRKSARISLSGAKVPSKLRYSLSSATEEEVAIVDDNVETIEDVEIIETPKKSKVVVLKSKRLSELTNPTQIPVVQKPQSPPSRRKSQRKVKVQDPSEGNIVVVPPAPTGAATISSTVDTQFTCNLSCLAPSSRILAFAEIARRMPDTDVADDVVPGSVHDWRVYTRAWCECNKLQPPIPTRTNSEELARALLPNTVAGSSKYEPIDLTESQPQATPEAELLSTPVNTILRASDAERLSQLFAAPATDNSSRDRHSLPANLSIRRSSSFSTPHVPAESRGGFYATNPIMYPSTATTPVSLPAKTPYEERIRQDHQKLTLIRKRAAAKGIQWSFNMTFDEIQALILAQEAVEERMYLDSRFQSEEAERRMHREQDFAATRRPSENPSNGFGMLLLPQGYSHGQSAGDSRQRDLGNANGVSNVSNDTHASNASHAHGSPPTETLPPLADVLGMHYRRVGSPSRPKSSRFRVDPRGLRGESPGPGTIINMAEKRSSSGKHSRRSRGLRTDAGERV